MAIQPVTTHIEYLESRGISSDTAHTYNITYLAPTEKYPRPAIAYPTVEYTDDSAMRRLKYIDGDKPKNIWLGQKPDSKFTLYDPTGGLQASIADLGGVCWLMNGEPAVWAFHTFRIARNHDARRVAPATCLFGEGRGLSDVDARNGIAGALNYYGVRHINLIIDTDTKGLTSAYRWYMLADEIDIDITFYVLPFEYTKNNGKDFNDLWLSMGRDHARVAEYMQGARIVGFDAKLDYFRANLGGDVVSAITADFYPSNVGTTNRDFVPSNDFSKHKTTMDHNAKMTDYLAALTTAWEREFNYAGGYKSDGWSKKNVRNHWRGEKDASAGYNRDSGFMQDFGDDGYCFDAKELGRRLGLEWPFEQRRETTNGTSKAQLNTAPAQAPVWAVPARNARFVSSREASLDIRRHMSGDVADIGEPLPFPLRALRRFGGLCKTIPAGKMVGIAGGTGNGKTALNETMIDAFNQGGIDTLTYSPEWLPREIQQRRIQRYSRTNAEGLPSVDYTAMQDDIMYSKELAIGVSDQYREGVRLTTEQQREVERVLKTVDAWAGANYCAMQTTDNPLYLETLLELIADTLADQRKIKRRTAVFIDYLQLAEVRESDSNTHVIQQAIIRIKQHVNTHQYIPFITSQVTKQAQKNGELIEASDAQYLRSDQFNLFLTINREFEKVTDNGVEVRRYLPAAKLYVDKNSVSLGQTYLRMPLKLERLSWIDEEI